MLRFNRFFVHSVSVIALLLTASQSAISSSLLIPNKNTFSEDEYQAIEHYHKSFIGKKTCSGVITDKSVQAKKSYLIKCLGSNNVGLNKYLKLSNLFWTKFNTNQILFLALMHGVYPSIPVGKNKPGQTLDVDKHHWGTKTKDSKGNQLDIDTLDCIRTNVALASLSKSNTYAGLKTDYLYTRQLTSKKFEALTNDFIDAFKVHLPNFTQLGYNPQTVKAALAKDAKNQIQVGDVIYINPIRIGFKSWSDQYDYDSKVFAVGVLKQLVLDMQYSKINSTNELSINVLNDAIKSSYDNDTESKTDNSYNDNQAIVNGTISIVNKMFSKRHNIKDIKKQIQILTKYLDLIDNTIKAAEGKIKIFSTNGKPIKPGNPNFHVVTVLDISNGIIKVAQMDGTIQLQAMSIDSWSNRVKDNDKVIILRQ